jgi:hypothetical protein
MGKMEKKSGVNLCNLVVAKFHKDERAQSMALGFVIIMGILLTSAIIFLSMEIPKQTKILEAEHAAKVPQDFAELVSAIDEVALSGDETASATCAFGLTSKSVSFVGVRASGGTLRLDNSSERFECIASSPGASTATDSGYWNCTPANFTTFDTESKYHVETFPVVGAKLELESGGDKIYDSGKDEYLSGEFWYNNFTVTNNTILYTPWLTIHAKNITVGPNSSINATGWGLAGGTTLTVWVTPLSASGKGEGGGEIPAEPCRHPSYSYCYCGAGGGGAGHYSSGGNGGYSWTGSGPWCGGCPVRNHSGGQSGPAYENVTNTSTDLSTTASGSGGACAAWGQVSGGYLYEGGAGGDGGGIVHLDAPTILILGNVSAEGETGHYSNDLDRAPDSAGGGGGGGSGGTILLKGDNINISGFLSAKGGDGSDGALACDESSVYDSNGGGGGGGSGGVIKIFYGIILSAPDGVVNHTDVSGGAGGLGGVGRSPGCSIGNDPKAGGNGVAGGDGRVYNESYPVYVESVPHYSTGYLVSNVTDIGYNTTGANTSMILYGNLTWTDTKKSGTSISMKVRTSTNANMSGAMSWENCPPVANGTAISDLSSVSNGHRYIQWRADPYTFERSRTPILHSVNLSYEYGLPVIADCKGSIKFSSHYFSLPNYELVYEHGATIKNQTSGEFMLHPPPITISKSGNTTALKISSVNLTGNDDTTSGVFSSAVKASYERADLVTGGLDFHNITLNITTAYPTVWRRWFNQTCKDAGLVYGTVPGNYNITGTGTSDQPVSIAFYGNDTHPVNVWLKETEVAVEIEG